MRFRIVCILVVISICSAYAVVYVPIEFAKYPGYETDFSWPSYAYIGKSKYRSSADELKDYWTTFKDTFSRSYKAILAADIVERVVPVPVPVPVQTVRTVYIKPQPKLIYRKIKYFKPR